MGGGKDTPRITGVLIAAFTILGTGVTSVFVPLIPRVMVSCYFLWLGTIFLDECVVRGKLQAWNCEDITPLAYSSDLCPLPSHTAVAKERFHVVSFERPTPSPEVYACGVLVYWCTGVLVYWCTGVLVYWCTCVLVRLRLRRLELEVRV